MLGHRAGTKDPRESGVETDCGWSALEDMHKYWGGAGVA